MQKLKVKDINADKYPIGEYKAQGWVKTHRQSKNVSFLELSDGSTIKGLQLVIEPVSPSIGHLHPSAAKLV